MQENSIKIAQLSSSLSRKGGGIFDVVKAHYNQLSKFGYNIYPVGANNYDINDWMYRPPVAYQVLLNNKFGYSFKLYKLLKQNHFDIIHLHGLWMYNHYAAYKYSKTNKIPLIISPHGMLDKWAIKNSNIKKKIIGSLFANTALKNANCLHALCLSELESIRNYGLNNPVAIIPNGINFPKIPDKDISPKKSGQTKKVLLFIGRIHPKKGLEYLIKSIHILNQKNPNLLNNWLLKIAGWSQSNHQKELKGMIDKFNLKNIIEFTGPVFNNEKQVALINADAFVLPSLSEGLPMAVLEAWSYKLPVLMTKHCNLPEGFEKSAAIEIETDPVKMASHLEMFMALPQNNLKEMGLNGYKLVNEKFSWEKISEQLIQLYNWQLHKADKPDFIYE